MNTFPFKVSVFVISITMIVTPFFVVHANAPIIRTVTKTIHHSKQKTTAKKNIKKSAKSSAYTTLDVAAHNSKSSCWTIINGNVYDLTKWIARHPGGEGAILGICGKNGSAAFNNQHGTSGRPEQILKTFQIGITK